MTCMMPERCIVGAEARAKARLTEATFVCQSYKYMQCFDYACCADW